MREWYFASAVDVMCASFGACLESVFSVTGIRSESRDESESFLRQSGEVRTIGIADLNLCNKLSVTEVASQILALITRLNAVRLQCLALRNELLELRFRASSNSPFQICREMCRNVFGGQFSSVSWMGNEKCSSAVARSSYLLLPERQRRNGDHVA